MNQVYLLNFPINIGDLIEKKKGKSKIATAARMLSHKPVNLEELLRVHSKLWTKNGSLDFEMVECCVLVFYFEEIAEIEAMLQNAPWSFDNSLLTVQKILPSMSPSNLVFDSTPI